jgi:hypothetical protein
MWMRSSSVFRPSLCQCQSRSIPGFNPNILRQSGIWGAANEAVFNKVLEKSPQNPLYFIFFYGYFTCMVEARRCDLVGWECNCMYACMCESRQYRTVYVQSYIKQIPQNSTNKYILSCVLLIFKDSKIFLACCNFTNIPLYLQSAGNLIQLGSS